MPTTITCTECDARMTLKSTTLAGAKVKCPKCDTINVVKKPKAEEDEPPARKKASPITSAPPSKRAKPGADSGETRRRPTRPADVDDEDEDDRPSKRKSEGGNAGLIIGLSVGGVVLVLGVAAVLFFVLGKKGDNQQAAVTPPPNNVANPPVNPPANPPVNPPENPPVNPPVPLPANGALTPELVGKVKQSTFLIKVVMADGNQANGSGFLDAKSGMVLTNAHVVGMKDQNTPPKKVEVVINSGQGPAKERTILANVVTVDQHSDLGVLRLQNPADLPTGLVIHTAKELVETQKIYVCGFPHSFTVGTNITISDSSVSSLRTNLNGDLTQVQVNGGMEHGNSGGPVVDALGRVVGVAVSGIEGTQLKYAIPADSVHAVLDGRIHQTITDDAIQRDNQYVVKVSINTIDPLQKIQKLNVDWWFGDPALKVPPSSTPPMGPRQTVTLTYDANSQKAQGEIVMTSLPPKGQTLWMQPSCLNGANEQRWTGGMTRNVEQPPQPQNVQVVRAPSPGKFPLELKSKGSFTLREEGEHNTVVFDILSKMQEETSGVSPLGANVDMKVDSFSLGMTVNGKPGPKNDRLQRIVNDTRLMTFHFTTNARGAVVGGRVDLLQVPVASRPALEDFGAQMKQSLEAATVALPVGELTPGQTWTEPRNLRVDTLDGRPTPCTSDVAYKFLGVRQLDGQTVAVIQLSGPLNGLGGNTPIGKLRGTVDVDVKTGRVLRGKAILDANIQKTQRAIINRRSVVVSRYQISGTFEVLVTRGVESSGPATKPFTGPNPGDPPVVVVPPINPNPTNPDARSKLLGGGFGRDPFEELAPPGGLLVGLEVGLGKFGDLDMVQALRPVFRVGDKETLGQQQGTNLTKVSKLAAKPGYAVGALNVRAGANADGLSITFMRIKGDRLDPADAYESDWVGDPRPSGKILVSGLGRSVVGLFGSKNKDNTTGIGLVFERGTGSGTTPPTNPALPREDPVVVKGPVMDLDRVEKEMPAPIGDVVVGGAGRYLVLHLPQLRKIGIFDVNETKITGFIPLFEDNVKMAAGEHKLILVYPDKGMIERYSLASREKEQAEPINAKYKIQFLAMGSASQGPLLVSASNDPSGYDLFFVDVNTLRPMNYEWIGRKAVHAGTKEPLRASANGKVFSVYHTDGSPQEIQTMVLEGNRVKINYGSGVLGHGDPSPDGKFLYTARGVYSQQVQALGQANQFNPYLIPSVQGPYYLSIDMNKVGITSTAKLALGVHLAGASQPLATLPGLGLPEGMSGWDRDAFQSDRRFHFIPDARLLIIIPSTNDKLVLHKLDMDKVLEKSGTDYLFVSSRPVESVGKTGAYRYQVAAKSSKGGLTYKLEAAPKGMEISKDGLITWTVPADFKDADALVILNIGDSLGKQVMQTFNVTIEKSGSGAPTTNPSVPPKEKPTILGEHKKLLGKWTAVKFVTDGEEHGDAAKRTIIVDNGNWISAFDGNGNGQARIIVDPTKEPRQIDLVWTVSATGGKSKGIYRFTDDTTIELCFNQPRGEGSDVRPTAFTTAKGEAGRGSILWVLKKANTGNAAIPNEDANKPAILSEHKKLQGKWTAVKCVLDGTERPETGKTIMIVDNGTWISTYDGNTNGQAKIFVDPTKDPRQIDLLWTVSATGGKSLGIYRFTDDTTIELCFNQPRGEGSDVRPTAFTSAKGEAGRGSIFWVLKKAN
jgi:uncharacterized protein (TIGR03067 family)